MTGQNDTIAAIATAPGMGAIAVLRLSGNDAINIAQALLPKTKILAANSHTVHFGKLVHKEQLLDEVVATLFKNPHSYTGEDVVEISCHGSTFIQQQILNAMLDQGARLANPGEFTLRAFLNGKLDLSQAEAVADLIGSKSTAAHELAMKQMRGGFSEEIKDLRSRLIKFASLIELELDFSEEDVEFADREALKALVSQVGAVCDKLIASFKAGNVIKNGVPVVIAGAPNAGKSTLLNALLNEERAIVSDIAGTTRDVIEDEVSLDGILFRFIDTAGIRVTEDTIEAIGVKRTMESVEKAAITVLLYDANDTSLESLQSQYEAIQQQNPGSTLLIVANKLDNGQPSELSHFTANGQSVHLSISAKNKSSIDALKDALVRSVKAGVGSEDTIVTNSRHWHELTQSSAALQKVYEGLDIGISGDLVALDIRHALHHLGMITGEISTDDLLDSIFRDFCIGK